MNKVTYPETLEQDSLVYVDVRSPQEFEESTIPGAVNLPVFTNQERDEIGTIYTQESPRKARLLGVEYLSPKLPDLIYKIKELYEEYQQVVIFCARGGMRSESLFQVANMTGFDVAKLDGGYKAYRRFILDELEDYQLNNELLMLHGYTGVGKTELLYKLKAKEVPIIDLEKMANHRGSAFGGIDLGQPTNQKHFDSLLWEKLESLPDNSIVAVEAESKQIGKSVIPEFFFQSMSSGHHILVESPLKDRVDRIFAEYAGSYQQNPEQFIARALDSLTGIKKHLIQKLSKDGYQEVISLCRQGNIKQVIEILLNNYYDPLYQHSQSKYEEDFCLRVNTHDLEQSCKRVLTWIKNNR